MICGVAEMLRQDRPIDTLERETLAAVYMALQRAPELQREGRIDVAPALEHILFRDECDVEIHFRTSIEPQLAARAEPICELSRLVDESRWAPLAGGLCVEWLRVFPDLPLKIATELVSCAVKNAPGEFLNDLLAGWRMDDTPDRDTLLLRLSAAFVVDFNRSRDELHEAAAAHHDLIWRIRDRLVAEHQVLMSHLSIPQLVFIVEAFAPHWPCVRPPAGSRRGNCRSWNATAFLDRAIHEIASRPMPEATETLRRLIDGPAETYVPTARHSLALQRKARRDFEYTAPSLQELQAVVTDDLPENIDDMRAFLADHLDALQKQMHAGNTDMWETYWTEESPRGEEFSRNRLVEQVSGLMPDSIRLEPEMRMPERRRADIVVIRNAIGLPVEIKGQWHREVWNAASDQLDTYYAREWRAEGRGVYVVLWFGDVPGKQLPPHPERLDPPQTPHAFRQMLIDRLPEARRLQIDVFVVDVTRPARANRTPADGSGLHRIPVRTAYPLDLQSDSNSRSPGRDN